jgi:serine/threonine protein kinase
MRSLRGCGRLNEFGKVQFAPDFYINLYNPDIKYNPEDNKAKKEFDPKTIFSDAYMAPEMIFTKIQDLDQNVDSWAFGCLMYHLLFGAPPASFYGELIRMYPDLTDSKGFTLPSDYFYHNLYPDELINDILSVDLEVPGAENKKTRMIDCINQKSFEALFNDIFPHKNLVNDAFTKNSKEFTNQVGCYLDLIAACLEFLPSRRPTIRALTRSPVFNLDQYENMISKQFSEIMILYKSPSLAIRDRVFAPLRQMCARVIRKPKDVIHFEQEILNIMDSVLWSFIERKPKPLEDAKKTVTT